jgi:hypothetical protein
MGMKALSEELKQLELLAQKAEKTETYPAIIDHFRDECREAILELSNYK